ncbi:phospholipase A and acyltransferase 3-like [Osmerus eperlanus]|uniref:phospholipase A and acyltransferase 3-like n=1 Tax=Osmerus eperlanus TaxID=29151 RepID=UPI002E104CAE
MDPTLYDKKPEPGDLIEFFRGMYQHWAVYIGDGFVIHFAPDSEVQGVGNSGLMSVRHNKVRVKKEKLSVVVGSDKWRVNNILDKKFDARPVDLILKDARRMVGAELHYNIATKNCEHFVTDLRYGKPESRQVCQAVDACLVLGGAAAIALVGFCGIRALAKAFRDEEKEKEKEYHY